MKNQVWLITGSSRGFGRAIAEAVLAAGHKLVATARNPKQLAPLVASREVLALLTRQQRFRDRPSVCRQISLDARPVERLDRCGELAARFGP